jgi:hypothetical protein
LFINAVDVLIGLFTVDSIAIKAGFTAERPGLTPRDLHRTEIRVETTGFIEIFASLKARKVMLYF